MIRVQNILDEFILLKSKINEYYNLIYVAKTTEPLLADLTSTSKTAEFNLWMWMVSAVSVIMDGVWAERQAAIELRVADNIPGTDRWFRLELMKFQYGDTLLWDDVKGKYYYATIDFTKQIIKRCAVVSAGSITGIKVATEDLGNNAVALSTAQLSAFTTYVRQIQWAGAKIATPISIAGDSLIAYMTVYYDGTQKLTDLQPLVESAWSIYIKKLPFNGQYSINKHGDYVEACSSSIKEVTIGNVTAKAVGGNYVSVDRIYTPSSGYLVIDPATTFGNMINYVAV